MIGLGFLIWQIKALNPIDQSIARFRAAGTKWVSIKVREGTLYSNYVNERGEYIGSDVWLRQVISKFRAAGISVGGWQFLYPETTWIDEEAAEASSAVRTLGLDHWLIDAENEASVGSIWIKPEGPGLATRYMDKLTMPVGFPIALCSYRFPANFPAFPTGNFVNHPKHTFIASQMYWIQANNPGEQIIRSISQYNHIRVQPHTPIGVACNESGWMPTTGQIREFIDTAIAQDCPGWGFWNGDEAVWHPNWLDAMKTEEEVPPAPMTRTIQILHANTNDLNVRNNIIPSRLCGPVPGKIYLPSQVLMKKNFGQEIEVLEEIQDGLNVWVRIGQQQFAAKVYDGNIYIK